MKELHLGISTCPNDTFTFHGLLTGEVAVEGRRLRIELMDVEELNRRLLAGDFDVAKASFHAALLLGDAIEVLPVGLALGHGVGPLLLGSPARPQATSAQLRVLCPGEHTTASLLYELFHHGEGEVEQVVFSDIMPALSRGDADLGVCIHEGRFTYRDQGLELVEDLGETWERESGCPLPLGGIVARRELGQATLRATTTAIRASLTLAQQDPDSTLPTMRLHAQEMSDEVLRQHVELYVNQATADLGDEGRRALAELRRRATAAGVGGTAELRVFQD